MSTDLKSSEAQPYAWVIQSFAEAEAATQGLFQPKRGQLAALKLTRDHFSELTLNETSHFPIENAGELRKRQSFSPPAAGAPLALFWSPTPLARIGAQSLGLRLPVLPDFSVLRRVLSKRFAINSDLKTPPHGLIAENLEQVAAAHKLLGNSLRIKKEYGHAGRGQRVMKTSFTPDDVRFINAGLKSGAFIGEKNLEVDSLYAIHGMVLPSGGLFEGSLCVHEVDEYDAPLATGLSPTPQEPRVIEQATAHLKSAAKTLLAAGYFGPFGLDLIDHKRQLYLIDLNARFTLGWSTGLGTQRSAALQSYLNACL